ncbi:MAG: 2Fe-2S iron-sulfur cluster-binding protein [Proteobacteria bacterium]|nr:2Fe-2S iron-sulfur cluster-binding protein [Pseudomonadota bacterium]
MPTVQFAGQSVPCPQGANLRLVLLRARLPLYNGAARALHCRGLGTCGTCAVKIEGPVNEPTQIERLRLGFPPHDREKGLRLACQCSVLGDLVITKYEGLFGQGDEPAT